MLKTVLMFFIVLLLIGIGNHVVEIHELLQAQVGVQ